MPATVVLFFCLLCYLYTSCVFATPVSVYRVVFSASPYLIAVFAIRQLCIYLPIYYLACMYAVKHFNCNSNFTFKNIQLFLHFHLFTHFSFIICIQIFSRDCKAIFAGLTVSIFLLTTLVLMENCSYYYDEIYLVCYCPTLF